MLDFRSITQSYMDQLNSPTIKHALLNWSDEEQGLRHPSGPLGIVLRDAGQTDIYAGKTRSILTVKGESVHLATYYSVISEYINLSSRGIKNLRILGKHFNQDIFSGQPIAAIKTDLKQKWVLGPSTQIVVNGAVAQILNPLPLEEIFISRQLFEKDITDKYLPTPDREVSNLLSTALGK